jgi:hypothetical protein
MYKTHEKLNIHCRNLVKLFLYPLFRLFRYKPTTASSVQAGGEPGRAVDGAVSTVHEGRRCTETQVCLAVQVEISSAVSTAHEGRRCTETQVCIAVPWRYPVPSVLYTRGDAVKRHRYV